MGRQTGEWLLRLSEEFGTRVEVAFDYVTDYELMESVIRDAGLWNRVRDVVIPCDVDALTGMPEGESAAEECFRALGTRRLARHHALADAIALRAAYVAVKTVAVQMAMGLHSAEFANLAKHALQLGLSESWLRSWMKKPAPALGGRVPIEVLMAPGGLDALLDVIGRIAYGVYT